MKSKDKVINDYIETIRRQANISKNHEGLIRRLLRRIDINSTPTSIMKFLDSVRKSESEDPLHSWIGTWNLYFVILSRFFKWLGNPCMDGIKRLKRKERSVYKPSDLWTQEEDLLFLKHCPSKRIRCYHMLARDSSCRPSEILSIKVKDIKFRMIGNTQIADVLVTGKTGSRPIPLINCLPYLKDYMDDHSSDPNSYLIRSAKLGKMKSRTIYDIYMRYQKEFFPKLLKDETVSEGDKDALRVLLDKPFNPYVQRHTSLTQKSKILKEAVLRQHAGWTSRSNMPERYISYFSNVSSDSILEAYGISPTQEQEDKLKPVLCSNCKEPNKVDSKFCKKCRMVLTYDAWEETKEIDGEYLTSLMKRVEELEKMSKSLVILARDR
jgi:integrase/recombinase XerD